MREITNITDAPHQRHTIVLEEKEIVLTLRFYPTIEQWCFDVEYDGHIVNGVKLSLGVLHIRNSNFPFDFVVINGSRAGIDPFKLDDFVSERCRLYIVDPAEMEIIRGVPVEI